MTIAEVPKAKKTFKWLLKLLTRFITQFLNTHKLTVLMC